MEHHVAKRIAKLLGKFSYSNNLRGSIGLDDILVTLGVVGMGLDFAAG